MRRVHLLRWRPRPGAQRRETTPRARASGAASQLNPSHRSSRHFSDSFLDRQAPSLHVSGRLLGVALLSLAALGAVAARAGAEPLVYVSNERSNSVTVIDAAADKVVATIPVGNRPRGIGVSPDGRTIYVALGHDNVIAVVDAASRAVKARFAAGTDPEAFAVSPDGARLYVSNEDANTASVIDTKTGKVLATIPVGTEPEGVAVSPDGRLVYVTAETTHTISVIDTSALKTVATILVGSRPRESAFTPDGLRAFVTAEIGGAVSVIDVAKNAVVSTLKLDRPAPKPKGVVVHPGGKWAYVANGGSNDVAVIDVQALRVAAFIPVGTRPWGLGITRDGKKLYVANGVSNSVSVIDTASQKVVATIPVGQGALGHRGGPVEREFTGSVAGRYFRRARA